jgi:hypothetical protein
VGARNTEIERWFIRRGVPHFIDDYAPTTDIWNRSLPMLAIAYVAGGLNALNLHEWTWQRNVLTAGVVIAVLIAGWAAINLARHRHAFDVPDVVGTPELALFLIGPTIPSLIFGQWGDAFQALIEGAAVLAIVFLATSYAVLALLGWAVRRSAAQLSTLASLVVRALPLLLLFTTFLFINAEVWQVAGTLCRTWRRSRSSSCSAPCSCCRECPASCAVSPRSPPGTRCAPPLQAHPLRWWLCPSGAARRRSNCHVVRR